MISDRPTCIIESLIKQKTRVGIDDISFQLKMPDSTLSLKLLELEFKGLIRQLPGKYFEIA